MEIAKDCKLCTAVFDLQHRPPGILFDNWQVLIVACPICKDPIMILKRGHIVKLNANELVPIAASAYFLAMLREQEIKAKWKDIKSGNVQTKDIKVSLDGYVTDIDMKENKLHWHCHLRKKVVTPAK